MDEYSTGGTESERRCIDDLNSPWDTRSAQKEQMREAAKITTANSGVLFTRIPYIEGSRSRKTRQR